MSCASYPSLINRYLNDQMNSSKVRIEDSALGLSYIAGKRFSNRITWNFIKNKWNSLQKNE
jgi:hypothetical protein